MAREGSSSTPTTAVAPGARLAKISQLDAGVVRERRVAIEMVRGDVEQRSGVGVEPRREIDLERGQLDHIGDVWGEGLEVEHRLADIAAKLHPLPSR